MTTVPFKSLVWITLFAIAMGFMESAVVIYLRELYYKEGFDFPLKIIPPHIGKVEFYREIATIVMLVGIGIVSGKTKLQRFAYFVLSFAVWDIFYYVFLYVFLSWPQSLSTWDILFLVPVPWVGPVWAPVLLSLLMIAGSVFIICETEKKPSFRIPSVYWWLLISGAFICIVSFMWDYLAYSKNGGAWSVFSSNELSTEIQNYIPGKFNSALFFTGFIAMCSSVCLVIYKSKIKNL